MRIKTLFFVLLTTLISCNNEKKQESKFAEVKNLSEFEKTDFIPTLEHKISDEKNSVYCVTLLYAWDEVREIINLPLEIPADNHDLTLLNNSKSFVDVLKKNEYKVSGNVDGDLITARAEFSKSLPFEIKLDNFKNRLIFDNQSVASFGITAAYSYYEQLKIVRIVYYKNDNNFIIKLLPKDQKHEMILFKTDKVFTSMAEMNEEIIKLSEIGEKERKEEKQSWKYYYVNYEDEVVIPKLNFNLETNFSTLEGKEFKTTEQEYRIKTAWQRTAFLLDESGAEVESEAEAVVECVEDIEDYEKPKPKKMIFDKDFLILLKRTDSQNPYFGLWVVNTELMIKE